MLNLSSRSCRTLLSNRIGTRNFSDHGHGHAVENNRKYLFGRPPGTKWESWELPYYIGMGGCFVLLVVGLATKPEHRITVWAHDEAIIRNRRIELGLPVEMGVYYSQMPGAFDILKEGSSDSFSESNAIESAGRSLGSGIRRWVKPGPGERPQLERE